MAEFSYVTTASGPFISREASWNCSRANSQARRGAPQLNNEHQCPECGSDSIYRYRTRVIAKCASCGVQFTTTSGTRFHARKLPVETLLLIEALHASGLNALQISQRLRINYHTAWRRTRALGSARI